MRVAVSMGDPSGVGAEVTARALATLPRTLAAVVFGDERVFAQAARRAGVRLPVVAPGEPLPKGGALVAVTRLPPAAARPGRPAPEGGRAQLDYLAAALACVRAGQADALCTAPVSKAQVQLARPGFVGHTEWLAGQLGERSVMMLAGERLRVSLATNHVQLARVPGRLDPQRLAEVIVTTARALRDDFGFAAPRVAVCGLNPHAGEGGAFGDEEARIVAPAVALARRERVNALGPFSADGLFPRAARGDFDGVVALYHDQGLIPVKLLDGAMGDTAVNVTLGLSIVRTSPDHGVAYDIAGRWRADPASMRAALLLAARLARRRDAAVTRRRHP